MDFNVYHHVAFDSDPRVMDLLNQILVGITRLTVRSENMSTALDALTAQVSENTSAEQSAIVLLGQLHDLVLAAQPDPSPQLVELLNQLSTSKAALAKALVANTV